MCPEPPRFSSSATSTSVPKRAEGLRRRFPRRQRDGQEHARSCPWPSCRDQTHSAIPPAPTRAAAANTGRGESGRRRWDPRASLAGMDRASTVGHSWAPTPEDAPEIRGQGLRAASARPRSRRPHSQREPTCASTGERQVWGDQHGTGGKINNTVRTTRSARRGRDTSGGGGRGRRFVRYLNV